MTSRSDREEIQLGMFGREDERLGHPLFVERWGNQKAFWIGVHAGQGLTAPAIERALGEQGTANVIARMINEWGYRLDGEKHTHGPVKVMLSAKHRTMLSDEARRRDIDMPELCRRILVQISTDQLFAAILDN